MDPAQEGPELIWSQRSTDDFSLSNAARDGEMLKSMGFLRCQGNEGAHT